MRNLAKIVALVVTALAWQSAMAEREGANEVIVNRMAKPLVTNIGLNNAGPVGIGVGVGYSILPWVKADAGYSEMKMTTGLSIDGEGNMTTTSLKYQSYAAGAKFAVPTWNLTPIGGLHVAQYSIKSEDSEAMFNGMKGSGTVLYSTLGVSWQGQSGFSTEAGMNVPLGGKMLSAAFIDVGWAWDIL